MTARDSDCPRGLGPPAPPRRPTIAQTMQCYNCGSDPTPTPFRSRPHPIYSTNPSGTAPPPSTDLDTGSGDTLSFHSIPFQTRWLCSATASNKSEHIYDAKRSGTLSFAALFHVRGLREDEVTYLSRGQVFIIIVLSTEKITDHCDSLCTHS